MKGSLVALGEVAGRKAAMRLVDGIPEDLLVDSADGTLPRPGAIYRAVVDRPLKGQGGAIVRLGGAGRGFLRAAKGLRSGQSLLVQVTGYGEAHKAVPVTARLLFKSRYAIVTPDAPGLNISRSIRDDETRVWLHDLASEDARDGEGLILRSACAQADEDEIVADIAGMRALARNVLADRDGAPELLLDGPDSHALAWRDWPMPDQIDEAPGAFERHGMNEIISTFLSPELPLSGGYLAYIEQTRAFVAVDVNTGADGSHAAGLKANIATARALPRALRCRGLGGQVVIDFAPMAKKERRQLEQILRAGFRACPIETALVGWTPLGHYELNRKRERLPLAQALQGEAP